MATEYTFNDRLAYWMSSNFKRLNESGEYRADIHETIMDLDASETLLTSEQADMVKDVLNSFMSFYHICDRNPQKFQALVTFLRQDT